MSSELKKETIKKEGTVYNNSYQESSNHLHVNSSRVNVTDLVNRLKDEKKQQRKHGIVISVAAV